MMLSCTVNLVDKQEIGKRTKERWRPPTGETQQIITSMLIIVHLMNSSFIHIYRSYFFAMQTLLDDKLACTCLTSSHSMAKIVPKLIRLTLMCAHFTPHCTHPITEHGKNTATLVSEWAVPENMHDVSKICIDDNTIYGANHVNSQHSWRNEKSFGSDISPSANSNNVRHIFLPPFATFYGARAHACECVNFFPLGMILSSTQHMMMINDIIRFDDVVVAA